MASKEKHSSKTNGSATRKRSTAPKFVLVIQPTSQSESKRKSTVTKVVKVAIPVAAVKVGADVAAPLAVGAVLHGSIARYYRSKAEGKAKRSALKAYRNKHYLDPRLASVLGLSESFEQ